MLKNQKRLEEEHEVKVKIIEAKDFEINHLKRLVSLDKEEQDRVSSTAPNLVENISNIIHNPREALSDNIKSIKLYLTRDEAVKNELSWGSIAINTSCKVLGFMLSRIF